MSRTIHINLLNDLERKGSSPVRLRVVLPMVAAIALLSMLGWWFEIRSQISGVEKARTEIAEKIEGAQEGRKAFEEASARKAAADNEMGQLESYMDSRAFFGGFLASFADVVPPTMQITKLSIPMPSRPVENIERKPGSKKSGGKTGGKSAPIDNKEVEEKIVVDIAGLVDSAKSVETLRLAMLSDAFTNLVSSAEIPAGSFRMVTSKDKDAEGPDAFNFELHLECRERKFK